MSTRRDTSWNNYLVFVILSCAVFAYRTSEHQKKQKAKHRAAQEAATAAAVANPVVAAQPMAVAVPTVQAATMQQMQVVVPQGVAPGANNSYLTVGC